MSGTDPILVPNKVNIVPGVTYTFSQLFTLDLGANPDPNIIGITYQIGNLIILYTLWANARSGGG